MFFSMVAHSLSVSHVEQDLYIQDLHHVFNKNNLKKKLQQRFYKDISTYLFHVGGWGFQLLCHIQIPQTLAHTLALITNIWSVNILNATFVFLLILS